MNKRAKAYIVRFLCDGTISEIPLSWLVDRNHCWWPTKTRNPVSLMSKDIIPKEDGNFKKFEVEIEKECSTILSARKFLNDENYKTTDTEGISSGRGKRIRKRRPFLDSDSEDDGRAYTPPPKISKLTTEDSSNNGCRVTNQAYSPSHEHVSDCDDVSLRRDVVSTCCDAVSPRRDAVTPRRDTVSPRDDVCSPCSDVVSSGSHSVSLGHHSVASYGDAISPHHRSASPRRYQEIACPRQVSLLRTQGVISPSRDVIRRSVSPPSVSDASSGRSQLSNDISTLNKILTTCASINIALKDIDTRLKRIEENNIAHHHLPVSGFDFSELDKLIPVSSIEETTSLENFIRSETKLFVDFLKSVGGRDGKDFSHRILKKVFANKFAVNCSWLGQRNNFRVCDLMCIFNIKRVALSQFKNFNEVQFEQACSEWFRQAKLRHTRELAKQK